MLCFFHVFGVYLPPGTCTGPSRLSPRVEVLVHETKVSASWSKVRARLETRLKLTCLRSEARPILRRFSQQQVALFHIGLPGGHILKTGLDTEIPNVWRRERNGERTSPSCLRGEGECQLCSRIRGRALAKNRILVHFIPEKPPLVSRILLMLCQWARVIWMMLKWIQDVDKIQEFHRNVCTWSSWCHCIPKPYHLASFKSRLVLPFLLAYPGCSGKEVCTE